MAIFLNRKDSESFVEDVKKLCEADNTSKVHKACYNIVYRELSLHLNNDDRSILNTENLFTLFEDMNIIAGEDNKLDGCKTALFKKFNYYSTQKPAGPVIS